jgi:hypothetical protein
VDVVIPAFMAEGGHCHTGLVGPRFLMIFKLSFEAAVQFDFGLQEHTLREE